MDETDRTLGELIKTMRKTEGLTQAELAVMVYSDKGSICRWECGNNITWFKFLETAEALGYTVHIEVNGGTD